MLAWLGECALNPDRLACVLAATCCLQASRRNSSAAVGHKRGGASVATAGGSQKRRRARATATKISYAGEMHAYAAGRCSVEVSEGRTAVCRHLRWIQSARACLSVGLGPTWCLLPLCLKQSLQNSPLANRCLLRAAHLPAAESGDSSDDSEARAAAAAARRELVPALEDTGDGWEAEGLEEVERVLGHRCVGVGWLQEVHRARRDKQPAGWLSSPALCASRRQACACSSSALACGMAALCIYQQTWLNLSAAAVQGGGSHRRACT